jgi:hypothetical protein
MTETDASSLETPYNLEELIRELTPRTDVIVLNLHDPVNVTTTSFFFKKLFKRVVCILKDPGYSHAVAKSGAIPIYMVRRKILRLYLYLHTLVFCI